MKNNNPLLNVLFGMMISAGVQGCTANRNSFVMDEIRQDYHEFRRDAQNSVQNNNEGNERVDINAEESEIEIRVEDLAIENVYDSLISRDAVEEISKCVYELEVIHHYIVNGTDYVYSTSERYGSAIALHRDSNGVMYLLTAFHVVDYLSAEEIARFDWNFIRDGMEADCYEMPDNLNLDYINSIYTLFFNLQDERNNTSSTDSTTTISTTLEIHDLLLNEDEDLALIIAELSNVPNEYSNVCSVIGDDTQLFYANELVTAGYILHELMIDYGIYSGSFYEYMTFDNIVASNVKFTPGYSGGGVFALRNGMPELVGVMSTDWMGKGLFVPISSVRNWLEEINLDYVLDRE